MRRQDLDTERLVIAFLITQVQELDPGAAKRIWKLIDRNPKWARKCLLNRSIAEIYTRLGLSLDRRQLLDQGNWT